MRGAATVVSPADDELATVARLRAHEEELSRRLDEARKAADARVFAAREIVARAEAVAEADCRQELARMRHEHAGRLGTTLDAIQDETARQVATITRLAAAHRDAVLDRLLAIVTGSDPS